jgi:hypothetical protein
MTAYDYKIKVGDLVESKAYKGMLGVVVDINVKWKGTPVAIAWSGRNPYGIGKNSIHHPDRLEVVSEGR